MRSPCSRSSSSAAGLLAPDAGGVAVHGSVGYAPQSGGLLDHLLPTEHFVLFGRGRGRSRRAAIREGHLLAEQLGWDSSSAPVAGALAGGLRQKLNVVLAMLGEPDVLLLDEPYQGLDLDSVQRFWELIWSWRHKGHAAIVASHAQDAIDRADGVIELGSPRVHHPAHRRDTLTHAFQKLDIRGRTELPAALAGRDSADGTHALA